METPTGPSMANSCSYRPRSPTIPSLKSPRTISTSSSSFPITIKNQKLRLTMGPCTWQEKPFLCCECHSGSCILRLGDVTDEAQCGKCLHPMNLHREYGSFLALMVFFSSSCAIDAPKSPASLITKPIALGSHIISRDRLVAELINRLHHFHIVRVRGTPASGKTTLVQLLANTLLERDPDTPLYVMYGWEKDTVKEAGGWSGYLKQETGVDGHSWLTNRAYLILDEGQQSYRDVGLWATLFKSIQMFSYPYIVVFTSYGSPTRGFSGFDQKHMPTPMVFATQQQISLRHDVNAQPPWQPVGLLLEEDEAIEVVERTALFIPNSGLILTQDLKRGLFKCSNGHAGLIASLVLALPSVPKLSSMIRTCKPIHWQTFSESLFHDPMEFFRSLRMLPFARGLPPLGILQIPTIANIFKEAIACDGLYKSAFEGKSEELRKGLHDILANGWLHAEHSDGDDNYVFASQIHRWYVPTVNNTLYCLLAQYSRYCQCIFSEKLPDNQLDYDTPLQLVLDVIRRFQPCQLAHAPRSLESNSRPLEDQYQKEFYRCLFPLLDGHVVVSPEFVIQSDTKGGTIDFLITQKKWGMELLRDRDRLQEHMNRFEPQGQYFSLIEKGKMDQYLVLNFTDVLPRKCHPGFKDRLYHVVFSENYRKVAVIDASNLHEVDSFVLMENGNQA